GNARQLIVSGDEIPSEKAREISGSRWVIERDENHSKSRNTCLACGICGSYEPYVWVSSAGVVIRGFHPQCSEDIVPEVSLEGRTIRIQPRKFSLSFQTRNDVGLITFKVSENGSAELITSDAHYWDNLTQAQLKELKARVRDSSFFTLKDERSGCPLKGPHESICATQETARITVNADGKSHSVWSDDPLVPTIDTSRSRELAELMSGLYNLRGYYPYNDTSHGQVAWQHGVEYVMRGGKQYWKDTMEQERPREQEAFSRLLVVGLLLNNSSLPSSDILNAEWVIQPDERYSMGVCAACGICPSPQKYKWVTSNGYEIWGYRPQCTEEWVIMLQWPGLDKSVELYNG
ncbi:hypothetical protein HYS54_00820, partial [Candidatus Micrarchaeota archaeon]|nr:hypothetical protein [Candidatus Micrarchaeota archaeon]